MENTASKARKSGRHDPFGMFPDLGALIPDFGFDFASGFDFGEMSSPFGGARPAAPAAAAGPSSPAGPASPARPASGGGQGAVTRPQPAQAKSRGSTLGAQALDVARSEAARGVKEEPPGSNDGPRVREYQRGKGGNYWCAHFVSWCVNQAGSSPFGHTGSVATLRSWGQNNGRYTPAAQAHPQPGDIFTKQRRDKQGRVVGGHTGFVLDYDPSSRRMRTVEGNSGDKVRVGSQSISGIDGVIRL